MFNLIMIIILYVDIFLMTWMGGSSLMCVVRSVAGLLLLDKQSGRSSSGLETLTPVTVLSRCEEGDRNKIMELNDERRGRLCDVRCKFRLRYLFCI